MIDIRDRLLGLDILRTFAIGFIVIYHFNGFSTLNDHLVKMHGVLWFGVDLFFILSGYLISNHWFKLIAEKKISFKKFWIKRFFRIIPSYYLILCLLIIIQLIKNQRYNFLDYFLFIQNYTEIKFFVPSWSLSVEEHFYLFFPLLSYLLLKFFKTYSLFLVLVGSIFISTVFRFLAYQKYGIPTDSYLMEKIYYFPTHMRLDGLLSGVFLGYVEIYYKNFFNFLKLYGNRFLILGLLLLSSTLPLLVYRYTFFTQVFGYLILAISFSFIFIFFRFHEFKLRIALFFHLTAKFAFFMYLSHQVIQFFLYLILRKFSLESSLMINLSLYLLVLYGLSYVHVAFFEDPIYRWGVKKFSN